LAVPAFLDTFEQIALSKWLRESQSVFGFYFFLVIHTIGMGLVVGLNSIVDLRLLGFASSIELASLKRYFSIMWFGFAINAISGVFLVIAYPTKSFTNIDFYVKLTLIGFAIWVMWRIEKKVFGDLSLSASDMMAKGRTLAITSLILWTCAVTAGRLLAYTCYWLLYGTPCE
jgi:hypothetical protein